MTHTKPVIIGAGEVECSLCNPNSNLKDGLALEVDGVEQHFCWKHLEGMARLWRRAWEQKREEAPLFSNGG